jgi:putative DNA primase/helicase
MSYFVKLETERGERTIWGVDLERAFKESLTKPQIGEEVGLRAVRQDPVTVKARRRDADGQVVGDQDLDTHRNRWIIEKHAFFEARAAAAEIVRNPTIDPREAVRQHPELASAYLHLRGAEEVAARRIRDPEDQRKFVSLVRSTIADSVERGEPLQPVRLRKPRAEPTKSTSPLTPDRDPSPAR